MRDSSYSETAMRQHDRKKANEGDSYHSGTNNVNVMQDVAFVQKLNNMGCQVWCDTQIIVKHLGVLEIDDSFQRRFE